jgi:hypothetical protein
MKGPKIFICIMSLLFIWHPDASAQNRTNRNGLRYGHWKTDAFECDYKIVPFSLYDTTALTESGEEYRLRVRYVKEKDTSYAVVKSPGYYQDSLSVRNGWCRFYDTSGKPTEMWEINNGVHGSLIRFSDGDTIQYNHSTDASIPAYSDTYIGNRAFERNYYGEDVGRIYYPNEDIIISEARPSGRISLTKSTTDTILLFLSAKKPVTVTGVSLPGTTALLDDRFHPLAFPLKLSRKDTARLHLLISRRASAPKSVDTLSVLTSAGSQYPIYTSVSASHLNRDNISGLRYLSLSRRSDRNLLVQLCGPYGRLVLKDPAGQMINYDFTGDDLAVIDLSELEPKTYEAYINMCYDDDEGIKGEFPLEITE